MASTTTAALAAARKRGAARHAFPLREEELVRLWEGQRFPRGALRTATGELLEVVYRGRRSPGPGPDFVDAILADESGRLLKGDVELHVLASAFHAHGHHRDPRYDRLALHVVFEDDVGGETVLSSGRRVGVVALGPWVARRREELGFWLTQPALWEEPCRSAAARMGWAKVGKTVVRMGEMRFRQKEARFAAALEREDAQQVLYEALLRTLGYRENAEAFAALARRLPFCVLRPALSTGSPARAEAILLEAAGLNPALALLSSRRSQRPSADAGESGAAVGPLVTRGLRPVNHPRRRLAGAARLLARKGPDLLRSVDELLNVGDGAALSALMNSWEVAADAGCVAGVAPALIGRGRALELLANAVLPFAAAWGKRTGATALSQAAFSVFRRLPRSGSYGAIRFLESSLRPPRGGGQAGVCFQQGLLYLYHQYCTQGGCDACPLGDRPRR